MPPLITDVCYFQKNPIAQLPLHADAVLHHARDYKIGVNCAEAKDRWGNSGSARGVRQITVLISHRLQKRNNPRLAEDDVAFRLIEEDSKAATNRRLVITERRKCNTGSRAEETRCY